MSIYNAYIETNSISTRESLGAVLKKKVPDGALYFEGIVSNGDLNRNGYIIESDAWFFNKGRYVKDFLKSGSVLWGHDADKPIGRPLSFEKQDNGDIVVSGYVFDDMPYTNGAISRGLVLGLSTGHLTHENVWRDKSGVELDNEEFWKLDFNDMIEREFTMVVTKAEIAEFSFVTTPSNRKSVLANAYAEKHNMKVEEAETLILNSISMKKLQKNDADEVVEVVEPTETPEVEETVETVEPVETPAEETPAEEVETVPSEPVETNSVVMNEITLLKNEIATLKSSFDARLAEAVNSIRQTERAELAKVVANTAPAMKSLSDFTSKYLK